MRQRLREYLCALFMGHDLHLKSTPTEVYVGCTHCGKRSSGWQVEGLMSLPPILAAKITKIKIRKPRRPRKPANVTAIKQGRR